VVPPSESIKKHIISSHYDVASQPNIDGNAFQISDHHFKKCKIFFLQTSPKVNRSSKGEPTNA
jgi:hypothetical protein